MGIDGRIFPVSATPKRRGAATAEFDFMDEWYPIQVKQKDKVGRLKNRGEKGEGRGERGERAKGRMGERETRRRGERTGLLRPQRAEPRNDALIIALTVREILEEQIAKKLA